MPSNSTISIQRIVQITEDADANYKDWYTEDSASPLVSTTCNTRASGKFSALGNQTPITLGFTNVGTVVGWIVEASAAFTLWLNGGPSVAGGSALVFRPIGPGLPAVAGPNDCAVTMLQVVAFANTAVYGRYCVFGNSP